MALIGYPLRYLQRRLEGATGYWFSLDLGTWTGGIFWTVATLVAATLSWFLFEKPINDLKSRFSYSKQPKKPLEKAGQAA
jgi:peptidoglycan/LPS O-acetylase OafA/YrhL